MTAKKTTKTPAKSEDASLPLTDQPKAEAPAVTSDAPKAEAAADPATGADQSAEPRSAAGTETAPAPAATEGGDPKKPAEHKDAEPAADSAPVATGVTAVFLLKKGKLGEQGAVVRVSRRKLADLKLIEGEDWSTPTAEQLAIGG